MTGSAGFTHYKPQAGEPAPPHRYPLLLALAAVAILVALVGLFTAGWLVVTAAVVAVAALAAFTLAPSPIRAQGWQPFTAPSMTGVLAPNRALAGAEVLAAGQVAGPEDIAISADGRTLYASSFGDGRIVRIDVTPGVRPGVEEHAWTGGSPVDLGPAGRWQPPDLRLVQRSAAGGSGRSGEHRAGPRGSRGRTSLRAAGRGE